MTKKFLIVLEIIWVITGLLCLYAGIQSIINGIIGRSLIFILLAIISFIFARVRHKERKKG